MDIELLLEAGREGKTEVLQRILQQNPLILVDTRLASLAESVLHVATKSGQLDFVHELMKVDPETARELNKDGFRPLDIAVIMGNLAMVKTILSFNHDLGRLGGKDNKSALHYAAVKGRADIIHELLSICPDCLEDVTIHGETAFHLAVKHYQFEAFSELVKGLERLRKEPIINVQDREGNTVLHLAVSTKQYACLNLLLDDNSFIRGTVEANVRNGKGLTALDISDMVIQDCYDAKAREILLHAGSERAQTITTATQHPDLRAAPGSGDYFGYFKFRMDRDSPSKTRNALLVVAALIATVCFQAGVNPPSGLLDRYKKPNNLTESLAPSPSRMPPGAGLSEILGSHAVTNVLFLFANTLGVTSSINIIIYLIAGFPFRTELQMSVYSMMFAYGFAVSAVMIKNEGNKTMAYVLTTVAFFLPFALRWFPIWGKWAWKYAKKRVATNAPLPSRGN